MKTDLDTLMTQHNLDALLISGPAAHNAPMVYMTGLAHFTGDLLKVRGKDPLIFCGVMERDEAARTGLRTRSYNDFPMAEYLKKSEGDMLKARALRYQQMLIDEGISSGRVALYGQMDAGISFGLFSELKRQMPQLELVGEVISGPLRQARATKDEAEVAQIRRMGQITTAVVGEVAEFLRGRPVKDGVLLKAEGQPLTVGDVKAKINLWLMERGAENAAGLIFAIGRDAGVPHSSGIDSDWLRQGQTIVFDIYPCQVGGGYFYDFTRTWCLGYAPDEALAIYEDVRAAYEKVMAALKLNAPFKDYQALTCDVFEERGHETMRKDPGASSGYIHSVGHGLGLDVHEKPWSGGQADDSDRLFPGSIFTIEPGLYYPERGLGVRLEDSVWARPDGIFEILAPYPLDLVIK